MTTMSDPLQEAMGLLPHGPEFRFVDKLLSMTPGREGIGEYRVRGDEFFLRGHFAGDPLFPGVLLIEAVAQLAGVVAQNDPALPPLPGLKLTALRAVKILGTARPGEVVRIEARVTGRLGALVQAEGAAFVSGAKVLSVELTLGGAATPPGPAGSECAGSTEKLVNGP
jgi:3-hydroxyacyl-[acyl-carrier-protein] dehydratase